MDPMPLPAIWVKMDMETASEGLTCKNVNMGIHSTPAPSPVNMTRVPMVIPEKWAVKNSQVGISIPSPRNVMMTQR